MSYLIFDTETTGFPVKDIPPDHPKQAHILQLACLKLDEQFNEVGSFYTLIKPIHWQEISPGALEAHGISRDMCQCHGLHPKLALDVFFSMFSDVKYTVAHNIKFDRQMVEIDNWCNHQSVSVVPWPKHICTMECTTGICMLPSKFPGAKYKWPKLCEAYEFLFKQPMDGAHDALADVKATAKVLRWLVENKKVV
jgi:DNA polymerase III epsilon subunit-like protein